MEAVSLVTVFLAVTAAAFLVSVRLGILMGNRLDRAMEARAAAGALEASEDVSHAASSGPQNTIPDGAIGQEDRGE